MNIPRLFILCGEAFSGKTTLSKEIAKEYGAKIMGRDELYFSLEKELAFESTPEEEDDQLWSALWPIAIQGVKNQLSLGNSVVFDDNCLQLQRREELRNIAEKAGVQSILIYLDTPQDVLKKRKEDNKISKERHDVPSAWMTEDSAKFERPDVEEDPIVHKPEESIGNLFKKIKSRL